MDTSVIIINQNKEEGHGDWLVVKREKIGNLLTIKLLMWVNILMSNLLF